MKTYYSSDDELFTNEDAAAVEQYEADLAAAKSPLAWLKLPWRYNNLTPSARVMNLLPDLFALFHAANDGDEYDNPLRPRIWELEAKYLEAIARGVRRGDPLMPIRSGWPIARLRASLSFADRQLAYCYANGHPTQRWQEFVNAIRDRLTELMPPVPASVVYDESLGRMRSVACTNPLAARAREVSHD